MVAAKNFGKVVLMGNPASPMTLSQEAYWAILRRELTVYGTWNSVFNDSPRNEWRLALEAMATGRLDAKPKDPRGGRFQRERQRRAVHVSRTNDFHVISSGGIPSSRRTVNVSAVDCVFQVVAVSRHSYVGQAGWQPLHL